MGSAMSFSILAASAASVLIASGLLRLVSRR
jgi:hypothetical protein